MVDAPCEFSTFLKLVVCVYHLKKVSGIPKKKKKKKKNKKSLSALKRPEGVLTIIESI